MRLEMLLLTICGFALPANGESAAPIEFELELENTLVIAPTLSVDAGEAENVLAELALQGVVEKVFENGVRLRARGDLRFQTDHPQRPGGTGGFGEAAGAPVGAFSGLSAGLPIETSDTRTRLETAYLQVDGGYGELRAGKDLGVAARFYEGPKTALTHARLDSTLLDPSGLSTVRTRHDLTGPSAKVSYATPRLLGVRAGISYTPQANADGLDRRPSSGTGLTAPDISNAVEIALNGTRRFRDSGVRVDAMLAWSSAENRDHVGFAPYGRVETVSAGSRVEIGDWTLGGAWLQSDNGLPEAEFTSWSAGLSHRAFDADWSLTYGEARDDGALTEATAWRAGITKTFSNKTRIAFALTTDSLQNAFINRRSEGVVVEITLLTEILKLTRN